MNLITHPAEMTQTAVAWSNAPLVLVPTMGALHAGHLALVDLAREHAGADGKVMVSIFVNPLQFGPKEDLSRYPRPLERDLELCRTRGVDAVFHPEPADMYPPGSTVTVNETVLAGQLCGQSRPGHFRGVCTVVAKLFNLCRPTAAMFGMKDYQQLAIIRQMVRDLNFPLEIMAGETVREPDGLALSSRNVYLTAEERAQAPSLRQALEITRGSAAGGSWDAAGIKRGIAHHLERHAPLGRIDYIEIVDAHTLRPVSGYQPGETLVALAVFFGRTRLIDNILL